ncbi:hypothetical protein AB5N19_14403 [Seiridium cardinale]
MDKLSPEIISLIVDELGRGGPQSRLSSYATISRAWQYAIERICFARIALESTSIATFSDILLRVPRRRVYLRELRVRIHLVDSAYSRIVRISNQLRFRADVSALLTVLHQWDEEEETANGVVLGTLNLFLEPYPAKLASVDTLTQDGLSDHSLTRRYLALPNETTLHLLPHVKRVKRFDVTNVEPFPIHPISLCLISGAFTRLENLELEYLDPDIKCHNVRLEQRNAFARGIESLCGTLPYLTSLGIRRLSDHSILNHSFQLQDMTDEQDVDLLCEAIRKLAQPTVVDLWLEEFLISTDLFRSRRSIQHNDGSDVWHALKQLFVRANIMSPGGSWYFTGDPSSESPNYEMTPVPDSDEEDDDEVDTQSTASDEWDSNTPRYTAEIGESPQHYWRRRVDSTTLEPLLDGFTEAILYRMPGLQKAYFNLWNMECDIDFVVQCASDGHPTKPHRRWWKVGHRGIEDWSVPESLGEMWDEWAGEKDMIEKGT